MKENAQKARAMDTAALQGSLKEHAEQAFRLRFQMAMGQTEGLKKLRQLRKERARMMTVIRERELGLERKSPEPAKKTKAAAAPKAKRAAKAPAKTKKTE